MCAGEQQNLCLHSGYDPYHETRAPHCMGLFKSYKGNTMKPGVLLKSSMLLLLVCLCGVIKAENTELEPAATQPVSTDEEPAAENLPSEEREESKKSELVLLSAEDAATLKKVVV